MPRGRLRHLRSGIAGGFVLSGFALTLLINFAALAVTPADTPAVTKLRTGAHDFGERLVLDLSAGGAAFEAGVTPEGALVIRFKDIDWYPATVANLRGLVSRYRFTLDGMKGGTLTLFGARPLKLVNSFPLSPEGGSGHRLVFDLAESPGAPPSAAGSRREAPPADFGTPPAASTEPSPRAPSVTSPAITATPAPSVTAIAELPNIAPAEPLAIDGGNAARPVDPLAAPRAGVRDGSEGEKRLTLRELTVEGAKAVKASEFEPFYRERIGKAVSLKDLNAIADAMTAAMRNRGYVLYKVIVPEQEIADGKVKLQAIEGYINRVIVDGDAGGRADLWHAWTQKIQNARPITAKVLERYTLLANDIAGKAVKSVLRPAAGVPGASDLVLKVTEKMFDASLTIDNRASPTTGPLEGTAVLTANNSFRLGEKISLTYNMAADRAQQEYFSGQFDLPTNAEGTTASFSVTKSTSAPGDVLKDLELISETLKFGFSLSHPLIRRRDETLKVYGGFNYTDADSDALSSRLYEDKIRTLNAGLKYALSDSLEGENAFDLKLTKGFEWLGASEEDTDLRSRSNGQNDFTKFNMTASRLQRLPSNLSLSATFSGQWSSGPLLSSEEFDFGGSSYGRAYDSSEITGDHGMALALELQYTTKPGWSLVKYMQPYAFYDFGTTWDIDADDSSARRTGASAGIGLRFGLGDHFSAGLELAKPLTRAVSSADDGEGKDPRFFFTLSGFY